MTKTVLVPPNNERLGVMLDDAVLRILCSECGGGLTLSSSCEALHAKCLGCELEWKQPEALNEHGKRYGWYSPIIPVGEEPNPARARLLSAWACAWLKTKVVVELS